MAVSNVSLFDVNNTRGWQWVMFDVNNTRGWQSVMLVYLMLITLGYGCE